LAVVMFAGVMPPVMAFALACAIDVRGVTCMPLVVAPEATAGTHVAITSPESMGIVEPVASSV
jgi:hypothetical protein